MASKKSWKIIEPDEYFCTANEYNIGGKKYARVTRTLGVIAKPGLLSWFQRVGEKEANRVKKKRQVLGTKVHKLIELHLQKKEYHLEEYEQEIQQDIKLFKEFAKDCKLKPEGLEQHLWSNEYNYAGTSDYIGYYTSNDKYRVRGHKLKFTKSSRVILDWKTSRSIYPEYWLQMAAYIHAFEELTGIKLDGAGLVQIRFGKIKVREKTYDELMDLFNVYKSVLVLYNWKYLKKIMILD